MELTDKTRAVKSQAEQRKSIKNAHMHETGLLLRGLCRWTRGFLTGQFIGGRVFKMAAFDNLGRQSSCGGVVEETQQKLWSGGFTCRAV